MQITPFGITKNDENDKSVLLLVSPKFTVRDEAATGGGV